MSPNGLVDSWMLSARGESGGILLIGCTEKKTEEIGRKIAAERGVPFRRIKSWRDEPEP